MCDKLFNTSDNIGYIFGMLKQAEVMAKKADPALTYVIRIDEHMNSCIFFSPLLMMRINATYVVVSFLIGMDHASDLVCIFILDKAVANYSHSCLARL